MSHPRQYKIPDWFLNRQKDIQDGKYSQVSQAIVISLVNILIFNGCLQTEQHKYWHTSRVVRLHNYALNHGVNIHFALLTRPLDIICGVECLDVPTSKGSRVQKNIEVFLKITFLDRLDVAYNH